MTIRIDYLKPTEQTRWDRYVSEHWCATPYHLSGWQTVIEETYGHRSFFLLAERRQQIVGVLPLVHIRHPLSGNRLISMPFLDMAGVLADSENIAGQLRQAALQLMCRIGASGLELRQRDDQGERGATTEAGQRVLMLLDLPADPETLQRSFRAKLRNQIRKPLALGLETRSGGEEFLDDFYRVFVVNMRDLGSPVHSRSFLAAILKEFASLARVFVVYRSGRPVAASLVFQFHNTVYNPWASSLRKHRDSKPNMLLYWSMLAYACEQGCTQFDFGRSGVDEGTYRFKQQWGARPAPLCWLTIPNPACARPGTPATGDNRGFQLAARLWSKIPVPISRVIGPAIRKQIGL